MHNRCHFVSFLVSSLKGSSIWEASNHILTDVSVNKSLITRSTLNQYTGRLSTKSPSTANPYTSWMSRDVSRNIDTHYDFFGSLSVNYPVAYPSTAFSWIFLETFLIQCITVFKSVVAIQYDVITFLISIIQKFQIYHYLKGQVHVLQVAGWTIDF